jgi:hypothetical protein
MVRELRPWFDVSSVTIFPKSQRMHVDLTAVLLARFFRLSIPQFLPGFDWLVIIPRFSSSLMGVLAATRFRCIRPTGPQRQRPLL